MNTLTEFWHMSTLEKEEIKEVQDVDNSSYGCI